jgi:myo-inositol-1(or 4)-monophosphatase
MLVATLTACSERVREALIRAEIHRLAEEVGIGADGAATTHVDQVAEVAALDFLASAQPAMNVLSEEVGFIDRGAALTAIVDPIDATNNALALPNFVRQPNADLAELADTPLRAGHVFGFPYYAFSVGVVDDQGILAGCVRNLPTGELFTAARGQGVELDGIPVQGSGQRALERARISLVRPETETAWRVLKLIVTGQSRRIRLTGCSALDLALIACGSLDAMVNPNRISPLGYGEKVVDYAGALALLSEMGGVLTSFSGEPVTLEHDLLRRTPLLAAATPELHAALIETLHTVEWDAVNP